VEKLRRAGEELSGLLAGRRGGAETPGFDPGQVAREVAERMEGEFSSAGIQFETRIPSGLPPLAGDARLLESLLLQLLRNRVGSCGASSQVSLAVGALERGGVPSVVIRVSHRPGAEGAASPQRWAEPDAVVRLVQELGGEMRLGKDAAGTQATAIRLTAQPQ
jgi:hypothetical protein